MLLTLTDHLTCPRCGPTAGLILLMERAEERRVVTGALGCPVCRTQYRIESRVADLRIPGAASNDDAAANGDRGGEAPARARTGIPPAELALRVAALMELGDGSGFVLVDGAGGLEIAQAMRAYLPDQEVVVTLGAEEVAAAARIEASALVDSGALPIADRTMRAAAHIGVAPKPDRLRELVRVVRPTGRIVIVADDGQVAGAAGELERLGVQVRARDETTVLGVVFGRG